MTHRPVAHMNIAQSNTISHICTVSNEWPAYMPDVCVAWGMLRRPEFLAPAVLYVQGLDGASRYAMQAPCST